MNLVAVIGPTSSGKTELAIALARTINGEVVSADSRQIYRGLDAGTAKPKRDAHGLADGIPYHLIDCAEPSSTFDAGQFASLAGSLCAAIRRRGRVPIVAGGTGLYVRALLEGLAPLPRRDGAVRRRLEDTARRHGRRALHMRLAAVDPAAALKIPENNIQRLVRALEVFELTGRPISSFWKKPAAPAYPAVVLRLNWPVAALKRRIVERAQRMWPNMLEELRRMAPSDVTGEQPGLQSLGYREALACLRGEISSSEGLQRLIRSTMSYAKRQRTWFRHQIAVNREIEGGAVDFMLAQAREALQTDEAPAC